MLLPVMYRPQMLRRSRQLPRNNREHFSYLLRGCWRQVGVSYNLSRGSYRETAVVELSGTCVCAQNVPINSRPVKLLPVNS